MGTAAAAVAQVPADVRAEILARIGDRVTQLLGAARKDSESKVKAELGAMHAIMGKMDSSIDALVRQLDEIEEAPEQDVEPQTVAQALAKLEQQWGKELGKLKQELHQTIYAHNHNADLMKHQKDALDAIRTELEMQKTPNDSDRVKQAKQQLNKADSLLKGQQKARKLEPLFRRLAVIEQKIAAFRWPGGMMPGMMPGMAPGMGMPPGMGMGLPGMGMGMPPGMGMPGMPGMAGMPTGAQLAAAAAAAGSGRMPGAAQAAAAAAARGMMSGHQAEYLANRSAAAAAMAEAAAVERGAFAGMGGDKAEESEEDEEQVDASRPPGLL
jgi:hypothetical protein